MSESLSGIPWHSSSKMKSSKSPGLASHILVAKLNKKIIYNVCSAILKLKKQTGGGLTLNPLVADLTIDKKTGICMYNYWIRNQNSGHCHMIARFVYNVMGVKMHLNDTYLLKMSPSRAERFSARFVTFSLISKSKIGQNELKFRFRSRFFFINYLDWISLKLIRLCT